jgi:hypothetical protein
MCKKNFEKARIIGKKYKMKSIGISFCTSFRLFGVMYHEKRNPSGMSSFLLYSRGAV